MTPLNPTNTHIFRKCCAKYTSVVTKVVYLLTMCIQKPCCTKNRLEKQDVGKLLMYTPIELGDTKLIEPKKWINRLLKILS